MSGTEASAIDNNKTKQKRAKERNKLRPTLVNSIQRRRKEMANRIAVEIQPYTTDSFIAASGVPHPLTFTHNAQQQTIQHEKGNTKLVGTALANNSNKESCTYIHCIYDNEKQTLTMKRVPIYNVHVQVDSPQTQNNNQANKEKPQLTAQEQKEQLGVTFGTRKKIRQIKEEEKNRINVDEIGSLNEQMQRSLQEKRKRNGTSGERFYFNLSTVL